MIWSCRGAPLGVPVCDDYTFLFALRFKPIDWLGPMDSPFYWRPLSRQLYFLLLGPHLIERPWIAAVAHAALLLVLFVALYRVARTRFAPLEAGMIAAFPITAEPARVLLGWPSGAEYLLAMIGMVWAVHETLRGRALTAAIAATVAILSHEGGALVLPALPIVAWIRTRRWQAALSHALAAGAAGAVFALGHAAARSRGMSLPSDVHASFPWRGFGEALTRALAAGLNLEDLGGSTPLIALGYAVLGVATLFALLRAPVRARLGRGAPILIGGVAWFALGLVPLAYVLPDWNGWRTVLPGLGLGFALTGALALASPWIAGGFLALRLVALLLAPPAPALVEARPPQSASQLSFTRLARLQRTVESTRLALARRVPSLPHGGRVDYWLIPALTEVGFQWPRALRFWYGDSTLRWGPFPGPAALKEHIDALVEYNAHEPSPATVIEPRTLRLFATALDALAAGRLRAADSLLAACYSSQAEVSEPLSASLAHNRARVALALGEVARADSLNRLDIRWAGESARTHTVLARLLAARGDRAGAGRALQAALTLEPANSEAIAQARAMGFIR